MRETRRFAQLEARTKERGHLFEAFDRRYRARFLLLGLVAFLNNVFSAPSSQLMNRYLTKEHDFSNAGVAALRGVTAGVPGLVGLVIGGRLAETRGRRPVAIIGLAVAAVFQMGFFVSDGPLLWITPTIAIIATAGAGLAIGTLSGELFPTEARGTSNGFLMVSGVSGSVVGLLARHAARGRGRGARPGDRALRARAAGRRLLHRAATPGDARTEARRDQPVRGLTRRGLTLR